MDDSLSSPFDSELAPEPTVWSVQRDTEEWERRTLLASQRTRRRPIEVLPADGLGLEAMTRAWSDPTSATSYVDPASATSDPAPAIVAGQPVPLPAAKPRALLALLLLNRNRAVPTDALIDGLWGEAPPDTAAKALQGYVSQLRKALGQDRIVTKPPGYLVRVAEDELDLDRFERLTHESRDVFAGDPERASGLLTEALALWRGPPLAEFVAEPFAAGARGGDSRRRAWPRSKTGSTPTSRWDGTAASSRSWRSSSPASRSENASVTS